MKSLGRQFILLLLLTISVQGCFTPSKGVRKTPALASTSSAIKVVSKAYNAPSLMMKQAGFICVGKYNDKGELEYILMEDTMMVLLSDGRLGWIKVGLYPEYTGGKRE